jgi:hypothetical protein
MRFWMTERTTSVPQLRGKEQEKEINRKKDSESERAREREKTKLRSLDEESARISERISAVP